MFFQASLLTWVLWTDNSTLGEKPVFILTDPFVNLVCMCRYLYNIREDVWTQILNYQNYIKCEYRFRINSFSDKKNVCPQLTQHKNYLTERCEKYFPKILASLSFTHSATLGQTFFAPPMDRISVNGQNFYWQWQQNLWSLSLLL